MDTQQHFEETGGFRGVVIAREDPRYEEARRVWNGMIDKRPEGILRCRSEADVVEAVRIARRRGLPASVRGGGHHVAGGALVEGGLVIDLSEMRAVRFDPATETAHAEGGARLSDVDAETLPRGRTVPMGVFGDTGIAGLTLGGGYGWQARARGLTCDNLQSARVVTSDARVLVATADQHGDLFWALRGGGTHLGVVTAFEYRTHAMPARVRQLFIAFPMDQAKDVLAGLRALRAEMPDELGAILVFWTFQPSPAIPKELWHRPFVGLVGVDLRPLEQGEETLERLRRLGTVSFDGSRTVPFGLVQQFFDDDYPAGARYYWRSTYLEDLSDSVADVLIDLAARRPSPLSSLDVWLLGGAIARVHPSETPLAHRAAPYLIGIEANWSDPRDDAASLAWGREVRRRLAPHATGGTYINFENPYVEGRDAAVYGDNARRVLAIRSKYDPLGLFAPRP
ncbi:MAG TPA: FAD-binding oxidoreductase [Polyangiaceae bacterium]|nr:FAD-binding oxidoreductase [Polyangiaceae bacterium]